MAFIPMAFSSGYSMFYAPVMTAGPLTVLTQAYDPRQAAVPPGGFQALINAAQPRQPQLPAGIPADPRQGPITNLSFSPLQPWTKPPSTLLAM